LLLTSFESARIASKKLRGALSLTILAQWCFGSVSAAARCANACRSASRRTSNGPTWGASSWASCARRCVARVKPVDGAHGKASWSFRTRSLGVLAAVLFVASLTAVLVAAFPESIGAARWTGVASRMAPTGSFSGSPVAVREIISISSVRAPDADGAAASAVPGSPGSPGIAGLGVAAGHDAEFSHCSECTGTRSTARASRKPGACARLFTALHDGPKRPRAFIKPYCI